MKLSHLLMTTSLCAVVAIPAVAQQRTFGEVDTNGDGELSLSELEAAFGVEPAAAFMRQSDLDGSGSVSVAEIQLSQDDESDDDDDDDDESDDDDDDESDDDESDDDD